MNNVNVARVFYVLTNRLNGKNTIDVKHETPLNYINIPIHVTILLTINSNSGTLVPHLQSTEIVVNFCMTNT